MIAFPNNPTLNEIYPPTDQPAINGRRWKFNGTAWDAIPIAPAWSDITGTPTEFPPAPHTSDKITDFVPAVNDAITDLDAGTY